jgi:hypothetical protein
MPLWGSIDNAANSTIQALIQVSSNTANVTARTALFNNATANVFQKSAYGNVTVGQFGVSAGEQEATETTGHSAHSGWVLRHVGTGLKAGRVWYETLVATGSITSDASDDTVLPDYKLSITTQPTSNSSQTASELTFTVVARSKPVGATLTYQWQVNNSGWANVANTAGRYSNNTSPTFTANNVTANGNVFRVLVMTTGAPTVISSNASILRLA